MMAEGAGPAAPSPGDGNKKRFFAIQEIISTELTYVERLKMTLDHVVRPLREMKLVENQDLNMEFESLQMIYDLHSHHYLEGTASCNLKFVELFEDICSRLDIYSTYLAYYEPAMQQRAILLTTNRRFAEFVDKVQKADSVLHGQSIESFLILPVQRIPRYRLLLERLLDYTDIHHPDYETIQRTLAKIREVAHYNNEAIRLRENNNKLMSIMLQIQSSDRLNLLENNNGRRFIKEGVLQKQCRRKYKAFQFWLFSDGLMYGEQTPLGSYTLNRFLPLDECQVTELAPSDPDASSEFIVKSPQKSFKVRASSEIERNEWFSAMEESILTAMKKADKPTRTSVIAPLWVPDIKSAHCSLCNAPFTLLFRRHHCRHCGKLICTNCSPHRHVLPNVSTEPVRVCTPCYGSLEPTESQSVQGTDLGGDWSDDDDDDSDLEARQNIDEDALDDFNEFEIERLKKGLPANDETVRSLSHNGNGLQSIVVRKTFFSNLASGLVSAASSLRPVALSRQSSLSSPPPPPASQSAKDMSGSPRLPPRKPRRPNTLNLKPLDSSGAPLEES